MLSYAEHGKFQEQTQVATHNFEADDRVFGSLAALPASNVARHAGPMSGSRDWQERNGPLRLAAAAMWES